MTRLALLVAVCALAASRPAAANSCNSTYPRFAMPEVPLGCPVELYVPAGLAGFVPALAARRGDSTFDVTATFTHDVMTLDVWTETIDEDCVEFAGNVPRPFDHYWFEIAGVEVGDRLLTSSGLGDDAMIVDAGPCPTPTELFLACRDPVQAYDACENPPDEPGPADPDPDPTPTDPGSGGCSTGGAAGGFGLGLAALALVLGRRRRR